MEIGETLGNRYRIEKLDAQFGLEKRFRATDMLLDRTVVVSVPYDAHDEKELRELISRRGLEAKITARVWHAHLVALLDLQVTSDGRPCFIQEWVDGERLDILALNRELSLIQALDVLDPIADAIHALHENDIIHGNLKPRKIVIPRKAEELQFRNAKLLDIGLQASRDVRGQDGQVTAFIGTPNYMSPEQILGKPVTPTTDVFGLGAIAYTLIYGVPPFSRSTLTETARATVKEPVRYSQDCDVPVAVRELIDRALAKEPDNRFVSASAFGVAVRSASHYCQAQSYDVFISYASEDKEAVARPLAEQLARHGLRVWFDEFSLRVGDSLNRSIDSGIAAARYGIVILSPHFFSKEWPRRELDGLVSREIGGSKVILPLWHEITVEQVAARSPVLADRLAISTSRGIDVMVHELLRVLKTGS